MTTVLLFVLILSVLVVVHEFGHFITAKKAGMKVYEFGIGFPPRAFGMYKDPKTKKWVYVSGKGKNKLRETVGGADRQHPDEFPATLYSVNWLPLGGFVKIKGENGEEARDADSFMFHKTWKKAIVLVAGVCMNFLLAAALLSFGLMIGLPTDVTEGVDDHAIVVSPPAVVIQDVAKDSPAETAGILFGDKIIEVDGKAVSGTQSFISYVAEHSQSDIAITLDREKERVEISVKPAILKEGEPARLGIALADAAIVRYPWYYALPQGLQSAGVALVSIFVSFFLLIKGLMMGQGLAFDVAGPVGIASVIGQSARLGVLYLINVTAMISLSLAAINILPIPALDGGRLFFVLLEKVIGRPVPMKYEQVAHTIGFVGLMILIVIVTVRDIAGLF